MNTTENVTQPVDTQLKKLERGIDLPQAKGKKTLYPFRVMQVGESFVVRIADELNTDALRNKSLITMQRKMSAISTMAGKRMGMKFQTRKIDNGIRVWRIA